MTNTTTITEKDDWEKEFDKHFDIPGAYLKGSLAIRPEDAKDFIRQLLASHTASVWKRVIEKLDDATEQARKNGMDAQFVAGLEDAHDIIYSHYHKSALLSASREDEVK